MSYLCPICHQDLISYSNYYQCSLLHHFDIAKEGYLNLLAVQHKRSKDPGDNKEMMQARRLFLEGGFYQPMRDLLGQILKEQLEQTNRPQLLDIGCGEGYYTQHLFSELSDAKIFGLDISKIMIRAAAKRYKKCHFVVASSQRLPFAAQQFDAIVRIYAPCQAEQLQRVIKDQGILLTVTPGARHLYQLKEKIYNEVHLHDIKEEIDGFELEKQYHIDYPMVLSSEDATRLLQMTPFAWRAPQSLWQELKKTKYFNCEAAFTLRLYRKSPSS